MDRVSKEKRSEIMRQIRSTNTTPELSLRRAMWASGLSGWRLRPKGLPGRPDVVFPKHRLAVFVDGCFWHGCPRCYRRPGSSRDYWDAKLQRNVERDTSNALRLVASGWRVIHFWEHDVLSDVVGCVTHVRNAIAHPEPSPGIILPARPLEFTSVLLSHGWHSLEPLRVELGESRITVPFDLPFGRGVLAVQLDGAVCVLSVVAGNLNACRHVASSVLSLDRDISTLQALATGRWRWIVQMGLGRFLRSPSLFEDCCKALFATNTQFGRTISMAQAAVALGDQIGDFRAFPRPERLTALDEAELQAKLGCGFRARYLRALCCEAVDRPDFFLGDGWRRMQADEFEAELQALLGFGPSSVAYLSRMYVPSERHHFDSWVLRRCEELWGVRAEEVEGFVRRRYRRFGEMGPTVLWLELTKHWHDRECLYGPLTGSPTSTPVSP